MPEKKVDAKAPTPADAAPTDAKPLSFEEGLKQLETIVKEMEGTDVPLERALDLFERGMKLSATCRQQLEAAETRVEILTRRAGQMQPQPFEDKRPGEADFLPAKPTS